MSWGVEVDAGDFTSYSEVTSSIAAAFGSPSRMFGTLLGNIAEFILENIDQQFETSGAHQWGGFDVLSESYAAWKADAGGSSNPDLQLSGEYRESWGFHEVPDGIMIQSSVESTKHWWHEMDEGGRNVHRPVLIVDDAVLAWIDNEFGEQFDAQVMRRL